VSYHVVIHGPTRVDGAHAGHPENEGFRDLKFVFGWDQPLQSFFFQVHDGFIADEDSNPIIWVGATQDTKMYEVEDLVREAQKHGLVIDHATQVKLYGEKDDGR